MMEPKYVVYISCKDEEGVVNDHPLRGFEMELEAIWYLEGYIDAIVNHTGDGKSNPDEIKGQFRISKIGEENGEKS